MLTNIQSLRTNLLAFHLNSGTVSREPILSDPDFVCWDVTNHTFVITPVAAMRLAGRRASHFVLMSCGEPIYEGVFGTSLSSSSVSVPVILTDFVVMDCFRGITKVPDDVWRMIGRGESDVTERLMALTNATTNVILHIDRGYPSDDFACGPDRRRDIRVISAVEQLFGKGLRSSLLLDFPYHYRRFSFPQGTPEPQTR